MLLLLLAWIVSGWWIAEWERVSSDDRITFTLSRGCLTPLRFTRQYWPSDSLLSAETYPTRPDEFRLTPEHTAPSWSWGFGIQQVPSHGGNFGMEHTLPLWAPFLALGLPAGWAWRADAIIRRRERSHLCLRCGYDRKGLASDAACPECGALSEPAPRGMCS